MSALPKRVAVIGAGTMGNGIAQTFAAAGVPTSLVDVQEQFLERGMQAIRGSLDRFVKKEKISADEARQILDRIAPTTAMQCVGEAELVVEAVSERLEIKRQVFADLDRSAPAAAILASNTSSISITVLGAATRRPAQVVGGQVTSDDCTQWTLACARALGKTPVEASDYPGFVSNRVLMPMINEAAYCLMEGVSSREGIDEIMKLGMGHPMGPLTLADLIGIDVCVEILDVLKDGLGDDKYRACPLLRRMVAAGQLGRKSGKGFYDY